ncbi:MAG TPA: hypothetical protein VJL29_07245 [Thermoguttaceae bacterium]|nr:hypothetical protein [Thermoguttaceae bacterium]
MTCSHCEKPTIGARVLCSKCLRRLKSSAPQLLAQLDSVSGLNAALTTLARAYDQQSHAQHVAYLKGRKRRLAVTP